MQFLKNLFRRTVFGVKTILGVKNCPIPVIWGRQRPVQLPSASFIKELSAENKTRLDAIIEEVKMFSRCYSQFPNSLIDNDWRTLLECQTMKQRLDLLYFIRRKEKMRDKDMRKLLLKRENAVQLEVKENKNELRKSLLLFPSAKRCHMKKQFEELRYLHSLQLEPYPLLIIDCQFLKHHSPRGLSLAFNQLNFVISTNKARPRPWPLYFCNMDLNNDMILNACRRHLQLLTSARNIPLDMITDVQQFIQGRNAVYLSPHAEEELSELGDIEMFIIGGIVDRVPEKNIHPQASLIAAKELGISAKKFPIDKYIKWRSGSKSLTLTVVSEILNDVRQSGGDWELALKKNIPVRNVKGSSEKNPLLVAMHSRYRDYNRRVVEEVRQKLQRTPR